jgi:hypothetical protein
MPEKKPKVDENYKGGQTVGKTPWPELQAAKPSLFNDDGKYIGPGDFPRDTIPYFEFWYKGQGGGGKHEDTAYEITPLLLEHISNNEPSLTKLDMKNRNQKDKTMLKIFAALKKNTTITELDLSHNTFDLAAIELGELLKTNKTLKKIDVSSCDMHDKAILGFAEALMCNNTLTELNLSNNFARKESKYIAEALKTNTALTSLNLDVNQIMDDGAESLKLALQVNTTLKSLSGYNNPVVDKELRKWLKKPRSL